MTPIHRAACRIALAALTLPLAAASPGSIPPSPASPEIIALPAYPAFGSSQRQCAAKTSSGLGVSVLRPASGPHPGATDVALINYIGYLAANGQTFDQAMQTPMPVDRVVPGFGEGLQLMSSGAIYRFCIPAALAYGAQGSGPIPANSDLVFQVELLDFKSLAEIEAMRAQRGASPGQSQP